MYKYIHGRPGDTFVTIAGSAQMAYAARIHARGCHQTQMTHTAGHNADTDIVLQAEEVANTWWGIVICERYVSPSMLGKSSTQMKLRPCWGQNLLQRSDSLRPTAGYCIS
jgi:hypothetical protein